MALGEKVRPTYVSVSKGKFRVWDGTQAQEHSFVSGHLVDINFATQPQTANQQYANHEEIRLHLRDGDDNYIVSCTAKTGAGRGIMKQLPNLDPGSPVEMTLSYEEAFKATTVFISQGESALKWFWKSSDPKEMPGGVKYTDPSDNKEKTQYNDQTAYLKQYTLDHVKTKLVAPPVQEGQYSEPFEEEYAQDEDDAPF